MNTIAVVEDNPSNMKLIRGVLKRAGYHVLEYEDADCGIPKIIEEQPNLIIMDVHLPGTNGIDATRLLKKNTKTSHIPLIIMTARVMDDEQELIRQSGCDDYMLKPIQYKAALSMIDRLLGECYDS